MSSILFIVAGRVVSISPSIISMFCSPILFMLSFAIAVNAFSLSYVITRALVLFDAKYSKMNKLRKSMWGERANQRLLKVPTTTVNQTPHTDGMFDLCVESDVYTTMLARLVRVEGMKVPSAENTVNEIDNN